MLPLFLSLVAFLFLWGGPVALESPIFGIPSVYADDGEDDDDDDDRPIGPTHQDLQDEFSAQHDMIKQDIADVKALVEALDGGVPLCGAGTEGQRFVVNGPEVCDNTTGRYWEQSPSLSSFVWSDAVTHCATLNLGNDQIYRLAEIQELFSLADFRQIGSNIPPGNPFNNWQSFHYWSATEVVNAPSFAWVMGFGSDSNPLITLPKDNFGSPAWCVR